MSILGFEILLNISVICALLPILALLLVYNSTTHKLRKVLFLLAVLWFTAEVANMIVGSFGLSTYLNLHIFDITSTLLYLLYFKLILKGERIKALIQIISGVYLIISIGTIVLTGSYFRPVLTNLALTMILPFVLSLISFYRIAKDVQVNNLLNEPTYWINGAILIHFGMSIVGSLICDIMYNNLNLHLYIWPVVIISNILYNILFTIGAWKMRRT